MSDVFFPLIPGTGGGGGPAGATNRPGGSNGPAGNHERRGSLSGGRDVPKGVAVGHESAQALAVGHESAQALAVGMVSLGCPKNLVDGEVMLGHLQAAGYRVTADADRADILVVNTCAFIREAKEESIGAILELAERKREGRCRALLVAGCLPQRYRGELLPLLPEVDAFVGTGEYPRIAAICAEVLRGTGRRDWAQSGTVLYHDLMPRLRSTPPHFAYVKISEGCDHQCTFCAIPAIRGRHVSRPGTSVVAEVRRLAAEGVREVSLVAQDSTAYGRDRGERDALAGLLRALAAVDGIEWIRVHTTPTPHRSPPGWFAPWPKNRRSAGTWTSRSNTWPMGCSESWVGGARGTGSGASWAGSGRPSRISPSGRASSWGSRVKPRQISRRSFAG